MKKIIKRIIVVVIISLVLLTIINQILFIVEKKQYSIFGQYVEVNGKDMYVSVIGKGENTIVILPGSGCIGSTVLYRPLAKKLAENNKVIILEYFGYGFSDDTNEKRSLENVVEEIRITLKKVCDEEKYILMPHSLSGLYSLYYAIEYPEEVQAIVGLDMTVAQIDDDSNVDWILYEEKTGLKKEDYYDEGTYPLLLNFIVKETGIMRLINNLYNKPLYDLMEKTNLYSKEEMKVFKKENNRYPSMALLKEYHDNIFVENIKKLQNVKFPEEIPILDFRADMSIEITKEYLGKDIEKVLKDVMTNTDIHRSVIIDTTHTTIFIDSIDEITEKTNEFINKL